MSLKADSLPIVETGDKLSFPWFTLHGIDGEADAYSCLVTAICHMAKAQKRVTAVEKPAFNAKYGMRMFLIRLGFIGDEYKSARKILLRNLSGNSSWKSGHKPEQPAAAAQPVPAEPLPLAGHAEARPPETTGTAQSTMGNPVVKRVQSMYPVGCRVELIRMDDPYGCLKPGDRGTVSTIDDTGTVFVDWDSGSSLGVVYGVDRIRRLS